VRIEVAGIPAPQGSKRHVGGGRMVEASRAVGPWREAIRAETQRQVAARVGDELLQRIAKGRPAAAGPVGVEIRFWLPRPKSAPASVAQPAKRPDLDKLCRAVLDGLVAGGAIADDGLVVSLTAEKRFATPDRPPGCSIEIWSET
jgi:crossover junction endodeoxyribonuclease RusA